MRWCPAAKCPCPTQLLATHTAPHTPFIFVAPNSLGLHPFSKTLPISLCQIFELGFKLSNPHWSTHTYYICFGKFTLLLFSQRIPRLLRISDPSRFQTYVLVPHNLHLHILYQTERIIFTNCFYIRPGDLRFMFKPIYHQHPPSLSLFHSHISPSSYCADIDSHLLRKRNIFFAE